MNKKTGILVFKVMMSLGILGYLFFSAWRTEQFHDLSLEQLHWGSMGLALLFCLAAHVVSYLRWRIMVRALDIPFTAFDAIRIGFIGSFFNLFAFGMVGGDSLRAYYVTRQVKHRVPEAISSVVADRLIGMMTMFSFASVAFLIVDLTAIPGEANANQMTALIAACRTIVVVTIVGYVILLTLLLIPQVTRTAAYQRVTGVPRIGPVINRFANVLLAYRRKLPTIGFCFLLSSVCVVCFASSIYFVAQAITHNHPTLAEHFIITPIAMTANAIPLPGGIGGMELALDFLYLAFTPDSSSQRGIVIAFAFRLVLLVTSAIGAIAWFMNRQTIDELGDKATSQPDNESG
ncbi:MAG: flippase-like domain-containing protein [Mariniblastus sp.]|nr:flippase-like domain-containing protein [Mariniblastus sp.]